MFVSKVYNPLSRKHLGVRMIRSELCRFPDYFTDITMAKFIAGGEPIAPLWLQPCSKTCQARQVPAGHRVILCDYNIALHPIFNTYGTAFQCEETDRLLRDSNHGS